VTDWEQELMDEGGLTFRTADQIFGSSAEMHHIATIYEGQGDWATRFKGIFDSAGFSLEDGINQIMVDGHFGPHPEYYHQLIFQELDNAVAGLQGTALRDSFIARMNVLRLRITDPSDILNVLISL
jgi:hypothetical protein